MNAFRKRLWWGLAVLALLSPLGLILPRIFDSGEAWGEWGPEALERMLGFMPAGLKKYIFFWKAPVGSYGAGGDSSLLVQSLVYIVSALLGIALVAFAIFLLRRFLIRDEK